MDSTTARPIRRASSTARRIAYVDGQSWNETKAIVRGKNGIAALTICDVPLSEN